MLTGLDQLRAEGFASLAGKRVGLVTHTAAVSDLGGERPAATAADLFRSAPGVTLAALFGPEHGLTAEAQDLEGVTSATWRGIRLHSLYGDTFDSLKPTPEMLADLDVLVIDLVDIGCRYYTFQATMLYCLEAAASVGLKLIVLDRPNPIGGLEVEGPTVRSGFESFVGCHPVAIRHGLTMGELARIYHADRVTEVDLGIVACSAWPGRGVTNCKVWVPPSPNMPSLSTAVVYPGMCLIEGTNLSEGRGTTRPFEYVGFPGIDPYAVRDRLDADELACDFLPVHFRPTFQKHAGQTCGGLFLMPRSGFRPVRCGLAVLAAFKSELGDAFRWRTERYEFVDHIPAIDLLFGSDRERLALDAGVGWREIAAAWEPEEVEFRHRRKSYLLYQ